MWTYLFLFIFLPLVLCLRQEIIDKTNVKDLFPYVFSDFYGFGSYM